MRCGLCEQNQIEGLNEFRQALIARESADKSHDRSLTRNAEFFADVSWSGREALDINAVAASLPQHQQFGCGSEAERQRLRAKARAVAEHDVRAGACDALSGKQNPALESAGSFELETAQHVDAPGHAAQPRGESAQQASLRRAEFHEVGFASAEQQPESKQRQQISGGSDGAAHGDRGLLHACACGGAVDQRAGAADEDDAKPGAAQHTQARSKNQARFLTRHADDHGGPLVNMRRREDGQCRRICHEAHTLSKASPKCERRSADSG